MIEPTPSARAQILALVASRPGITSADVAEALPTIERKAVCAHLATLVKSHRLDRDKVAGSWHYRATDGAAAVDTTELEDDDPADSTPAPASRITTHVAQAPRRRALYSEGHAEAPVITTDTIAAKPEGNARAADLSPRPHSIRYVAGPQTAPVRNDLSIDRELRASIDDNGTLAITAPDISLRLGPDQTRQLGEFLAWTIAVWSRP